MIKLYKSWRAKADTTGWGTDPDQHNDLTKSGIVTVKSVILDKCLFYYTFEEIMGTNPSVAPPHLSESGRTNRVENTSVLEDDAPNNPNIDPEFYTNWVAKSHTSLKNQVDGLAGNDDDNQVTKNEDSQETTKKRKTKAVIEVDSTDALVESKILDIAVQKQLAEIAERRETRRYNELMIQSKHYHELNMAKQAEINNRLQSQLAMLQAKSTAEYQHFH
ncbi:hypothetical protein MMC22_000455 [Lobaria immixta]|nr:hypothetical protein [Lobaria immixta]